MKIEDLLFGVIELGLLYAISWFKMSYIGSAFWLLFISFSYYLFTVPENPITTKQQAHTENLKTHYYAAGWIAALVILARVIVQLIDAWKEGGMSDDTVETLEDWGIAPLEDADSERFWVFIFQVSILVTGFAMYYHLSKRQPPEEDQQEDFFLSPGWTTLSGNVILFLLACCGPTLVTLPFVVFYICSRFIMAFNGYWGLTRRIATAPNLYLKDFSQTNCNNVETSKMESGSMS
eukprot:CAMPEP_0114997890 /NCGR_PEP_ID=MMETSP0216-20121206/15167_1 /TAXON_ID=223996 /ORGANISM="Protocruzia adherens, Strain Boccale" /LENGTH=234 /DNA_ID=CAMNT_0002362355 /DNA_START=261 /DNA_END=965 /DNA_ORIENTATION=+